MPDVSSLSYADAVEQAEGRGFSKFKQANSPSTPELKDKVIGTNPPANQTSAITNEITVIVGSGPETKQVPDVAGQTVDVAQKNLTVYGFTKVTQAQVDSTRPAGAVIGTNPPQGPDGSGGHGDRVAGVQGQPVRDARPDRHVLDGRRAAVTGAGLDGHAGQGRRRRCRRLPAQPGGVSEPAGRVRASTGTASSR